MRVSGGLRVGRHALQMSLGAVLLVTALSAPAHAQTLSREVDAAETPVTARQALLTAHVHEYVRRKNGEEGFGYAGAVIGAGTVALGATAWNSDRRLAVTWVTGCGLSTSVFVASFALSRDARIDVLRTLLAWDSAVFGLGIAVDTDSEHVRLTMAGYSAGFFGFFVLHAVNSAAPHTKTSTMRSHRDRLENGEVTSDAELAQIERDFQRTRWLVPGWVMALPLAVGSGVALIPAFDDQAPTADRNWSALFGGLGMLDAVFVAITRDPASSYEADLREQRLDFMAGPGSMTVSYRF